MPERTAKILETTGTGGTLISFFTALSIWLGGTVDWLNTNYMAVMASCAIVTTTIGAYGSITRTRLAKQQKRREAD